MKNHTTITSLTPHGAPHPTSPPPQAQPPPPTHLIIFKNQNYYTTIINWINFRGDIFLEDYSQLGSLQWALFSYLSFYYYIRSFLWLKWMQFWNLIKVPDFSLSFVTCLSPNVIGMRSKTISCSCCIRKLKLCTLKIIYSFEFFLPLKKKRSEWNRRPLTTIPYQLIWWNYHFVPSTMKHTHIVSLKVLLMFFFDLLHNR